MERQVAAALLASLLERIDREHAIGAVSSLERKALQLSLDALGRAPGDNVTVLRPAAPPAPEKDQGAELTPNVPPTTKAQSSLVLESLKQEQPCNPGVMLCLDFGTAMSKAFAFAVPNTRFELELGTAAGGKGYALPSSVFVSDDGKAYFGQEAIDLSQELVNSRRKRLDSIKGWLSLRSGGGNLDSESCVLDQAFNPTPFRLTEGELLRLYLAYLTDIACAALAEHRHGSAPIGRYVKRRFARPCWPNPEQATWADEQLRAMLAHAQILADTFSGRWRGGIPVSEFRSALDQLRNLTASPDYLIDAGLPEPVAVAAGAFDNMENQRDAFMVVDVGAGTTDFGLFIVTHMREEEPVKVFQVEPSIQGLMQAGDKVDTMLRTFIARKESVDETDASGRLNMADLNRRIRGMKEALFLSGRLDYRLADGTQGQVTLNEFLDSDVVKRFGALVEEGFRKSLEAVDESWLRFLSTDGRRLRVVLTGGSSRLPMMQTLTHGPITIRGEFVIGREQVDARPFWLQAESEALNEVYPQLAVAIGGAAEEIPKTVSAPPVFAGGPNRPSYAPGRLQLTGN